MGRWVLIAFGIIALTTGFVLYLAADGGRPTELPEASETVDSQISGAPQSPSAETRTADPAEESVASEGEYQSFRHSSQRGSESTTSDNSDDSIAQPEEQAQVARASSFSPAASVSVPGRASGSIEPEQGLVGEMPNPQGVPPTEPTIQVEESVPVYSDPTSDVLGTATGFLLPGEGEPEYTGPLPGEGELDIVGPLPGENEPLYTGPLPGENELPATGPLPGEETSP